MKHCSYYSRGNKTFLTTFSKQMTVCIIIDNFNFANESPENGYAKTHELQTYSQQLLISNLNLQAEDIRKILSMYNAYFPKKIK